MEDAQNIRSGNMKVSKMKAEISKRLAVLELGGDPSERTGRATRKLEQGCNFLEMIEQYPYNTCKTVSGLTKMISERRRELQAKMEALNINMPGHQLSFFEVPQQTSYESQEDIAREQMWLQGEIDWLHKCLGMCKNREYFK